GHRQEGGVPDRRRGRGRRQEGQDLHHLAARACADRQEEGRVGGSGGAGRRQGLRDRQGRVALTALRRSTRNKEGRAGCAAFCCAAIISRGRNFWRRN